jgi:hypothetical protein
MYSDISIMIDESNINKLMNPDNLSTQTKTTKMKNPPKFPEELNQERLTLQKANGIKFFHVNNNRANRDKARMTIAYSRYDPEIKHGNVYMISTSIVNESDIYDRKRGCYLTTMSMAKCNYILVKKSSDETIEQFLANMFCY